MEGLGTLDPSLLIALGITVMMGGCLVVMFSMRDRMWMPPMFYTRTLQCRALGRAARVRIVEHLQNGVPMRSVQRCSLWIYGRSQCHQECLQTAAVS